MTKAWNTLLLAGLIAVAATGCVSQKAYDDLNLAYRRGQEQIENLKAQLEEANSRIKALQEAQKATDPEMLAKLEQAIAERNRLAKALADAEAKLRAQGNIGPVMLPPALDQALRDLAARYPDLMTYDPALGMVKFKSDLTFDLGSDVVKDHAKEALGHLATILKRPDAEAYEARIVGHTDDVRISKPETKAKYPTNWHLSAGRAISVKDVLEGDGVPPVRMGIAGYGQYRPVVPNAARGGAEPNRRVEIYLVKNTYTGIPVGAEAPAEAKASVPAKKAPAKKAESSEPPESFK